MKPNNSWFLTTLLMLSLVLTKTSFGQITQPTTVTILPNNSSFQSGISLNGSEQWFKFSTDSLHVAIKLKLEQQGLLNGLSKIELFKDAGGGLIQIVFTDTLRTDSSMWVSATFLNPSADIYLRVSSLTQTCATCSGASYPTISLDVMALQASCNSYVQPPCQYVKDSSFEFATLPCSAIPNPNTGACANDPYVGFANCFWNMPLANTFVNCGGLGSLASLGTSDYYYDCNNSFGAHTGLGFAGAYFYTQTNPTPTTYAEGNYREYITEALFTPLTTGKTYSLTIWIKRNSSKSFATSNIEVALSNGIYTQNSYNAIVSPAGQIIPMTSSIITSTNWTKLTTVFAASGNYSQITIGNFTGVGSSIVTNVNPSVNITQNRAAYYFVDDVSIIETFTTSVTNPVCLGLGSATINVIPSNAGTSYTWTSSPLTPTLITVSGSSVVVSPTVTTNYTVSTTNALGCIMTNTVDVLTTPITFTASSYTFCPGVSPSITVTATGLTTYTWSPNSTISGSLNSPTITVTPTSTTTYTVFGNLTGCPNTYSSTVTISDLSPTVSISSSSLVCVGSVVTVSTNTAAVINYVDFGDPNNVNNVNPFTYSSPGSYTISVESVEQTVGCTSYSFFPITVVAALNPTLTISPSQTICAGQSTTLTVNGANTYTWSTTATTNSIIVSPTVTTTYTVVGAGSCGTATAQVIVNVINPPVVTVSSATICAGKVATLTATGATSYSWSTGANTSSLTVSPTTTTNYTVTGFNSIGCSNTAVATVSVNPNPLFIFLPSTNSTSICAASSFTIKALPATSLQYSWSTGATTNSIVVNPSSTTVYTATGTNTLTGCSISKTFTVNMLPVAPITVASATICRGATAVLTASNSTTSYTWSTGTTGSNTISVSPLSTTNYTVTGTTACGTSSAIASVYVNTLPFIAAVGGSATVCSGTNLSLIAVPNNTSLVYTWSNGFTGNPNIVSPTTTTVYTVTATNTITGCSSTKTKTVTVTPLPTLSVSTIGSFLCTGLGTATITATGANSYTWSPPGSLSSPNGSVVIAHPTVTTTYTVTGSIGNCTNTKTVTITVTQTPTLTIAATSTNVCLGNSATLTATGATSYSWTTGVTTPTAVATPTQNTTYYGVYGTIGYCNSYIQIPILVSYPPNISTTASPSIICAGNSSTLTASAFGAISYTWQPGSVFTNTFGVTPASTTVYTVTGSNGVCVSTKTVSVTVAPNPIVNINAMAYSTCIGGSITLTASGATNYTWSPAGTLSSNTGSIVVASPSVSTIYTITGQVGNCIGTKTVAITIIPNPSVTVNSPTICVGNSATLTANGASTYYWTTSQTTNSVIVSPTITTIYTVVGTNSFGCNSSMTSTVTVTNGVIPPFSIIVPNNGNICANGTGTNVTNFSTNISNPSNYTYLWLPGNSTSSSPNISISQPINVSVSVSDPACGTVIKQDVCVNYVASSCCNPTLTTLTNTIITDVAQIPNSTYKVSGTLTFNIPNVFQAGLSNKEFLMSTGSKIIVTPTTKLDLHICKLYSCEGMWEGIELQSNTSAAAHIDINDGTTIEDAYMAVSANNYTTNVGNQIIVNVATFNKNYIDVNIKDWVRPTITYNFESRTGNYTSQSSTTSPGGNLKCSQYYSPTIRARSYSGIYANNTTSVNVGASTSNTFYVNSFSNKDYGIVFEKTSGLVTNAKFSNMIGINGSCQLLGCTPPLPTGIGVAATTDVQIPTTIIVTSTPAPVTFTNVQCAVYVRRAANLHVLNTVIENPNQSNWNLIIGGSGYGYNGIYTEDIKNELHINYNTIKNAWYGVQSTYVNASNVALLSISNNTILTTANNFTTSIGINVSSAIGFVGDASTMPIAANILTNVSNGVRLTGLIGGVRVSGNTINMKTGNTSSTSGSAIFLAGGNTKCQIDNNTIFGNSNGLVQNYILNKIGINVKGSSNCLIQCNYIDKVGTGVRYDGICTSPGTGLFNNSLNAPIRRGLEFRNSASMGTQGVYSGTPPNHTVLSISKNQWNGTWNSTNTDQTYVFDAGSSALGNRLCVGGSSTELPTDNQWNTGFPFTAQNTDAYTPNLTLLSSSTAPPVLSSCPSALLMGLKMATQNDSIATLERDEEYRRIITQNLTDPTITNESKWQLKDFMYRNIANGFAPVDATVQSFYSAEQSGSVNDNRTIDSLILLGDYTQAASINGAASTALVIEQTAKDYNSLWLQKFSNPDYIATSSDILTLDNIANQCIHKGGKSVAHARALLGAIYNHPSDYDDDCMDTKVGSRSAQNISHFETKGNTINLYPNPNNGNFTLNYYLTKDVPAADVIVEDVTGKLIYKSTVDVTMDNMSLHLTDAKTGIYFVKVMSGKEIISVNKVIISN